MDFTMLKLFMSPVFPFFFVTVVVMFIKIYIGDPRKFQTFQLVLLQRLQENVVVIE